MKKLFLLFLLCICLGTKAQNVETQAQTYNYCIACYFDAYTLKFHIPGSDNTQKLIDENGKIIKFKSVAEVITYMSKKGWVYVDAFRDARNDHLCYYFQKSVTNDEQALEGLSFEK